MWYAYAVPHKDPDERKAYLARNAEKIREQKRIANRQYHAQNADKIKARREGFRQRNREHCLARDTGMIFTGGRTLESMRAEQNNKCPGCGDELALRGAGQHVDHCHITGIVRAILCARCNRAIGQAREQASILRTLAEHVEKYAALAASLGLGPNPNLRTRDRAKERGRPPGAKPGPKPGTKHRKKP